MRILKAESMGMCFGVRDAIDLATRRAGDGPVTVLGELVHNETVLDRLKGQGVLTRHDPGDVTTPEVIITAHGASGRRIQSLRDQGFQVTEATCPLVHRAHQALDRLVAAGFHPVVIGQANHVEVRGLTEDHPGCCVVLSEEDVDALPHRDRFGVVAQTTQPIAWVRLLVERIRRRFPGSEVRFTDTVCQPTKDRQKAAEDLASRCDVVVVVGGPHSNNTRRLADTSRRHCSRVHVVLDASELEPEWFQDSDTVGITAGTSTPDSAIQAVENALREMSGRQISVDVGMHRRAA
jgi:4-hydroxy-3-methylbut-2-en-1-yl diphosphate reductase